MKNWNQTLSKAEALEIYQYKGTAYYPRTEHNSKIMAEVVSEHLTKLRNEAAELPIIYLTETQYKNDLGKCLELISTNEKGFICNYVSYSLHTKMVQIIIL